MTKKYKIGTKLKIGEALPVYCQVESFYQKCYVLRFRDDSVGVWNDASLAGIPIKVIKSFPKTATKQ